MDDFDDLETPELPEADAPTGRIVAPDGPGLEEAPDDGADELDDEDEDPVED